MRLRDRYMEWCYELEDEFFENSENVFTWIATWAFVSIVTLLVHSVPGGQEATGLELVDAWLLMSATTIFGSINAWSHHAGKAPRAQVFMGTLVEEFSLVVFAIVGMAQSTGHGAQIMGIILLMIAAMQGLFLQPSLRHPFGVISLCLGIATGALLFEEARSPAHLVLLYPTAIFLHVIAGTWSRDASQDRRKTLQYREALLAQQLLDVTTRNERLRSSITDVLGLRHDLNNMFQIVSASTSLLKLGELDEAQLALVEDMSEAHDRMFDMLSELTSPERSTDSIDESTLEELEVVDVGALVGRLVEQQRRLFRGLALTVEAEGRALVEVRGGEKTLARIIENLLKNAREGDGARGASRALVRVEHGRDGMTVRLVVEDDGPGFSDEMLRRGYELFGTTKEEGTGLGLYTIDRITVAHGGKMELGRSALGGARVILYWPSSSPEGEGGAEGRVEEEAA